jgi:hypothetical protein
MTLAIDGHNYVLFSSSSSGTITLTTVNSPDVVVIFVMTDSFGTLATVSGINDGASLTWQRRGVAEYDFGFVREYLQLEEWFAIANSGLSNDTITVNLSSTALSTFAVAFGVSGANTASPFDPHAGLPAIGVNGSGGAVVSTTNPNSMIIGAFESQTPFTALNPGVGFSLIDGNSMSFATEYKVAYILQNSLRVAFSKTDDFVCMGDAINALPVTGAAFPNLRTYPKKANILD